MKYMQHRAAACMSTSHLKKEKKKRMTLFRNEYKLKIAWAKCFLESYWPVCSFHLLPNMPKMHELSLL